MEQLSQKEILEILSNKVCTINSKSEIYRNNHTGELYVYRRLNMVNIFTGSYISLPSNWQDDWTAVQNPLL